MKAYVKILLSFLILSLLVACAQKQPVVTQETYAARMQKAGVQIIHVGQQTMLVLSSDQFFYPNSTHLNTQYYGTLNDIASYLKYVDTETVKVAGYTDSCGNKARSVALSRQQAQNIADYLTRHGLGIPLVYSIGYGSASPIASNATWDGQRKNRRIQITYYRLAPNR